MLKTFPGIALLHAATGNKADICLAQGVLICQSANQCKQTLLLSMPTITHMKHTKQYTHTEEMTELD